MPAQEAEGARDRGCAESVASPFGPFVVVTAPGGAVREVVLPGAAPITPGLIWDEPDSRPAARQLAEYLTGQRQRFEVDLAPRGTPFQRRVWAALVDIPYGTTVSYGELAESIGAPRAVRAVGQANHRNPIPILIPCHRVVGRGGELTGYGGGLELKRALLGLEAAAAHPTVRRAHGEQLRLL